MFEVLEEDPGVGDDPPLMPHGLVLLSGIRMGQKVAVLGFCRVEMSLDDLSREPDEAPVKRVRRQTHACFSCHRSMVAPR